MHLPLGGACVSLRKHLAVHAAALSMVLREVNGIWFRMFRHLGCLTDLCRELAACIWYCSCRCSLVRFCFGTQPAIYHSSYSFITTKLPAPVVVDGRWCQVIRAA